MPTINMLSSANSVKAHGVLSAYIEQVKLVKQGLKDFYEIKVNKVRFCDIMHYHTIDFKHFLSIPFSKLKGTTVAYVHFVPETIDDSIKLPFIVRQVFYKYIIWFYKSVDHLVVVNPYFIQVLKSYNIDEEKVTYIPNFVAEENFYKYEQQKIEVLKRKYDIPLEKFVILGVGQIQNRKGILDFVEVAKNLPHIQFLWAGGFSFGSITDGYKELKVIMENPPSNVKFVGIISREEMNDIYNVSDLMFLPSFNELFPMSVLEAMSLKMPILLRDLDIYHNILFDSYLKGKGVKEFIQIIKDIEEDHRLYKKWSEKSWKCHEFYSRDYVLNMWKEFYDSIHAERKKIRFRSRLNEK